MTLVERSLKERYNDMLSSLNTMRVYSVEFGKKSNEQFLLEHEMKVTLHCIHVCESISLKNSLIHTHMSDLRYEPYILKNNNL